MAITDFFLGKENMDKLAEIEGQYMSEFPGLVTDDELQEFFQMQDMQRQLN